jgi:hypothetical protein
VLSGVGEGSAQLRSPLQCSGPFDLDKFVDDLKSLGLGHIAARPCAAHRDRDPIDLALM